MRREEGGVLRVGGEFKKDVKRGFWVSVTQQVKQENLFLSQTFWGKM